MRISKNERTTRLKRLLLRRRKELEERIRRLRELNSVSRLPATDDAEVGLSSLEDEKRALLLEGETEELRRVDDALGRLREGSYGLCEVCGKPIPLSRLRVVPFADLCVKCKENLEKSFPLQSSQHGSWELAEDFYRRTFDGEEEEIREIEKLEGEAA